MDTIAAYDSAAPGWGENLTRLGYARAYAGFLAGRTLPQGPVLDVGSGDGLFAMCWVDAGGSPDLTLLDPSQQMLARAQARLAGAGVLTKAVRSRLEDISLHTGYAAVLAAHVLEHVDDPVQGLRKLADCLLPDGRLYLVASKPHWCNWLIWFRFRHRWFTEADVNRMAGAAGLAPCLTHRFAAGPPRRTSQGYIFTKREEGSTC